MSKTTYVAIGTDGTVHTRSSATMPYTHAVLVGRDTDNGTGAYSWHKSEAAAHNGGMRDAGRRGWLTPYVVPVIGYPYNSAEAKRARNGEIPEPTTLTDADLAELNAPIEPELDDDPTLFVIPCAANKLDHPAPAVELYNSHSFRHTLAAAENEAAAHTRELGEPARVVILSAKHGLLELNEIVEPYDVTMSDAGSIDSEDLAAQLVVLQPKTIVAMLPQAYSYRLHDAVEIAANNPGLVIAWHDTYEGAAGIGEQRAVASSLRRGTLQYDAHDTLPTYCEPHGHAYPDTLDACPHCAKLAAEAPAPMPRGNLVLRSLRVDDALWKAAQTKAKRDGIGVSEIVRNALQAYVNG